VVRPTAMVLTVVPFRSLDGSSSTSRGGFIGCAGTDRVVIIAGIVVCVDVDVVIYKTKITNSNHKLKDK